MSKILNTSLVDKGFNQQKELAIIYEKMGNAVEKHRLEVTALIELSQNMGSVDDTIIKRLDDSVELLLKTLDTYSKIPKDNRAGLGSTLVPHLSDSDSCSNDTILIGFRLPLPSGISVYITLVPPTITFKYNCTNIIFPSSLSSFILINSSNISPPASSVVVPDDPIISLTVVEFVAIMVTEATKLSAISGIFSFEKERLFDLANRYKELASDLKIV